MDWVERMNNAIGYIEDHLDGEIDPNALSRILLMPYPVFQRMFGPLTGIALSEYIRRRRLSIAANELGTGKERIIELALKYGYESADAFSAAFRRMHGISPHEARTTDAPLTFYPRMTFSMTITGGTKMDYRVIEKDSFTVVGVRKTTPEGGGTWTIVKQDGSLERLSKMAGANTLGLCFGFDAAGNNDYMCGVEYAGDPAGFDTYEYPATKFLVFSAEGKISEGTLARAWKRIYGTFMPQARYSQIDLPTIERYIRWEESADQCAVEIMIPVA